MRIAVAFATISILTPVIASEGKWTEGFGQGNLEYFIEKQGLRLNIGCPTQEGSADASSSVTLSRASDGKELSNFTITANGLTFEGPIEANSRVGTNNFLGLLEAIRKDDASVKVGNKKIIFPKSNSSKVLPVYGKKFQCNVG
jgi:hypothetical protein